MPVLFFLVALFGFLNDYTAVAVIFGVLAFLAASESQTHGRRR